MTKPLFLKKCSLFALCLLYIGLYSLCYIHILFPQFSYYGLIYEPPTMRTMLIAVLFAILPVFWLPPTLNKPSKLVIWLIYIIAYIPMCIVRSFWGIDDMFSYYVFLTYVCFGLFLVWGIPLLPEIKLRRFPLSETMFSGVVFVLFLLINLLLLSNFRSIAKLSALTEVYEQRDQYKNALGYMGNYLAYFIPLITNIINIYYFAKGLIKKNYVLVFLAVASQLLIFAITGLKSVLFSIPFAGMIYFFFSRKDQSGGKIVRFFIFMLLVIVALNFMDLFIYPANLILRRFLTMQGQLTAYYFDFFENHPKCYLGYSFLKKMTSYPYATPPSGFIGAEYLGREGMHANANFFADAFANFGLAGVVIYSTLLGCVLWVYDSISKTIDLKTACMLGCIFAFNVINTSLLISLMTHGFLFTFIFLLFHPKPNENHV